MHDYAQESMPEAIWSRLSSKKWFLNILNDVAMLWCKAISVMTLIVTIVPVLVTCFYGGNINNDPSGNMLLWNNIFSFCQLPIFVYTMYVTNSSQGKEANAKKGSQHVRLYGLTKEEEDLYSSILMVDKPLGTYQSLGQTKNLRIESITTEEKLERAGFVLAKAFEKDETMKSFMDSFEGKISFYKASMKSLAYFKHVLAVYDHDQLASSDDPRCVMAIIPVLSKNQEEINVFNSFQTWEDHGFVIPGATPENFPLPSDELMELGQMKFRQKHGLMKRKYILIAHFGADPDQKGKGFGRVLMNYIAYVSQYHQLSLVLEATTAYNISQYQKYGFKIIDKVEGKSDWVLMMREWYL
ncbi:predicted protein [Chaetoceros tenuissimus]|uniref:N-acetyltransferase domain-containing protein n=1 Tax=Chaetoceros tenuissimus TaxID=426638 RepID=A0AAD3H227_9STRA|nr:predicted protein [Chaetoceros tenuissimus]